VLGRAVAVARGDVAAVFVVDVPERDGGVVSVALCHPLDEERGGFPICGTRRAVVLARAGPEGQPVARDGQAFGVSMREPRRGRGRRRREVGEDAVLREQVEQTVEPAEVVAPGDRLEQ
jgi:hypothetical protein